MSCMVLSQGAGHRSVRKWEDKAAPSLTSLLGDSPAISTCICFTEKLSSESHVHLPLAPQPALLTQPGVTLRSFTKGPAASQQGLAERSRRAHPRTSEAAVLLNRLR